jgi:two-component system, response regulator YesN
MFRIMIVDDESVIRKGLTSIIEWDKLDCAIVYEAANGLEAKNGIISFVPDIIITDIKMPGMDGIDLAKYIYENHPRIKIIILTGYADFSYAQSSIKYGVTDFVLKPTSNRKIIEAVEKTKSQLMAELNKENMLKGLECRINEDLFQIREKLLHEIIDRIFVSPAVIKQKSDELGICLKSYFIIAYETEADRLESGNADFEERSLVFQTFRNMLSQTFRESAYYNVTLGNNSACTVLSFEDSEYSSCLDSIMMISQEIMQLIANLISCPIYIGISGVHKSPAELSTAHEEALNALSDGFYNKSTISVFTGSSTRNNKKEFNFNKDIDRIIAHIQTGNPEKSEIEIVGLIEKFRSEKLSIEYVKNISILFSSLCLKLLSDPSELLAGDPGNKNNLYKQILESRTFEHLIEILKNIIAYTASGLKSNISRNSYLVKKALGYLAENYDKRVTLQDFADHIHVNGSYLSRIFSRETGETITEAVMRMKIDKARELLKDSRIKTYEVASLVGIEDPSYFSLIFKKHTGISPKEYKNSSL